ncbi:MAG TPA: SCO family protein [Rhizomicrobium sp.]|jgi:protein SCO1/2|nr:SCO family protein [Rhizomicrobium sp.]
MKWLSVLLFVLWTVSAHAGLSRVQLDSVSAAPLPGAHIDLKLAARDAGGKMRTLGQILDGRPAFFSFVDYTCNTLCGTDLELLSAAIQTAGLKPANYRIVVFGIDPKDTPLAARTLERNEILPGQRNVTAMLMPDKITVARATKALGFRYAYDAAIDQFAHPAVVYLLAPDGTVLSVLSPFALSTADLKTLLQAAAPAPGLYDRVRLLCYCYDPATGIYSLRIAALIKAACGLTLVLLGGGIFFLIRRGRHVA